MKENFLKWEKKSKIFDITENDISLWSLIRLDIFEIYSLQDYNFEGLSKRNKQLKETYNVKNIIKLALNSSFGFLQFLYCSLIRRNNVLSISWSEKKMKFDGKYVDLINEKIHNIYDFNILEFPDNQNNFNHYRNKSSNSYIYGDFLYLMEKLVPSKINFPNISKKTKIIVSQILELLDNKNICQETLESFIFERILRNLKRLNLLIIFLRVLKPRKIITWSAYSPFNQLLIIIAKKQSIPLYELQHGHIYPEHIGYFFPTIEIFNKYFIDRIFVYNTYYKKVLTNNNWPEESVIVLGDFTYRDKLLETISTEEKDVILKKLPPYKKQIVTIISQHTISDKISQFLQDSEKLKDTYFLIKLHPKFVQNQIKDYQLIKNNKNVRIIFNESLNSCISISDVVLGSYSTGLIDALIIGECKVCVLPITGSDFFADLINDKIIEKINKLEDIQCSNRLIKSHNFLKKFNPDLIVQILSSNP